MKSRYVLFLLPIFLFSFSRYTSAQWQKITKPMFQKVSEFAHIGDEVYGLSQSEIYQSTSYGIQWKLILENYDDIRFRSIYADGGDLYCISNDYLFPLPDLFIWKTNNGGQDWDQIPVPPGMNDLEEMIRVGDHLLVTNYDYILRGKPGWH